MMPYKYGPYDICEFADTEKLFYPGIQKHTNLPEPGNCDFKVGKIFVNDYMPDLSTLPPVFQSGDYMIDFKIMKNGEMLNGYKVIANLIVIPG